MMPNTNTILCEKTECRENINGECYGEYITIRLVQSQTHYFQYKTWTCDSFKERHNDDDNL